MGDITISSNLVRGIDNYNTLLQLIGQNSGDLAQHGCFAHSRLSQQQNAAAAFDNILNYIGISIDGSTHSSREPYNTPVPITNGRNTVQGGIDTSAIVRTKLGDIRSYVI